MPLLRVGQKVVVSSGAYFGFFENEFKSTEYQAEITSVDPADKDGMTYRIRPVGADYDGWWFAEAEVTAESETKPSNIIETANGDEVWVENTRSILLSAYVDDTGRTTTIRLTPDEADQLSDMLRRAAAEARGTEGTP